MGVLSGRLMLLIENHPEAERIFLGDYVDPYQYEGISPEEAFIVLEELI